MIRFVGVLAGLISVLSATACSGPSLDLEKHRVVILVVDGLRPDYVTAALMPRLNRLAERGVRGLAHHAVFPTVTRVNGPSIFTGRYPGGHGLLGNSVYLPEVDATRVLDMSDRDDVVAIDEATGGALLTAPSLGELLDAQGVTYFAASSGSTGSATFMNHRGAGVGLVHREFTLPPELGGVVAETLGPVPDIPEGSNAVPLVARTVDALLLLGVDRFDADVMAGWLTEPDGTAHGTGIGSPETVEALAGVDAEIGRLIDGLAARGVLGHTDILVTSDHGFTTETGSTSLSALLVDAGLKEGPRSTDVVVAGGAIHVREGGSERVGAIVRVLQATDWVGAVFTRGDSASGLGARPGTVAFSAIGWDHERSADILVSPNWSDEENEFGFRGEVSAPGVAGHGSASPWDIHATLVVDGPSIKDFISSPVPTGNVDILPTLLAILGVPLPSDLDGRVLTEVLEDGPFPAEVQFEPDILEVAAQVDGAGYDLSVYRTRVGSTVYLDGFDVVRTPPPGGAP
jgi:arylsulfatase A-like enzyme